MRITMIGTTTCVRCKSIKPRVEEYCKEHSVSFQYKDVQDIKGIEHAILVAKGIYSAPAFIIYREDELNPIVLTGDDVFSELR